LSVISYEASALEIYSTKALQGSPAFAAYEVDSDELAGDLSSFALANAIYAGLVEGYAAEISARRNAMENASKNAVRALRTHFAASSLMPVYASAGRDDRQAADAVQPHASGRHHERVGRHHQCGPLLPLSSTDSFLTFYTSAAGASAL
jgi:hypothetical protein